MGRWKEYLQEQEEENKRQQNLFEAIKEDSSDSVRELIEEGVDVNAEDDEGRTPLFLAVEEGSVQSLIELIDSLADINGVDDHGNTVLHVAAKHGQVDCVEALIESEMDVNRRNKSGKTALCVAAVNGEIQCLQLFQELLSSDDLERHDNESLCETVRKGHLECVVALLCNQYGLSKDDRKIYGPRLTELSEFASSECRKLASSKNETNKLHGYVALCCASILSEIECLRALIDFGLDVNPQENLRKVTPLCCAAEYGSLECIKALLNTGADVSRVDEDGKSALHHASEGLCRRQMHEECVCLLLTAGAGVNVIDKHGNTALALAVKKENDDCVRHLLLAGANVYIRNVYDEIALDKSSWEKYLADSEFDDGNAQCIITAVRKGQSGQIASLIENGVHVNVKGEDGTTALIAASWEGHGQCVDMLLRVDKIDINARDYHDRTALFAAACGGHIDCVKKILARNGVIVDSQNSKGSTPLMVAAKRNRVECVDALISAGADVNSTNSAGQTALILVAASNASECVHALISAGADMTTTDSAGHTALMTAASKGIDACLQMLIRACGSFPNIHALCADALVTAIGFDQVECAKILLEKLPIAFKSLTEMNRLLTLAQDIRGTGVYKIILTLLRAGAFYWEWYDSNQVNQLTLTRELILNGYSPGEFDWKDKKRCTPLQYAFRNQKCKLVRYLLAHLYLAPYDVSHFQRDTDLANFVFEQGSEEIRRLHHQLVSAPWSLEVLSILQVFNLLRRYGCKQEEALGRSGIIKLLPKKFLKRLMFLNPVRHLCVSYWDRIEGDFMNSRIGIPDWPTAETMVNRYFDCSLCSSQCKIIVEEVDEGDHDSEEQQEDDQEEEKEEDTSRK